MRLPAFLHTLKFRIIATVAASAVLAALATATLMLHATERDLRLLLETGDRADRERTAALIGGKLESVTQALQAVARHSSAPTWRDRESMERFLLANQALHSLFDGVIAALPDGSMLARIDGGAAATDRPRIGDREYFQQAMKTDQPVVSRPLLGKVTRKPIVIVALPVLNADGSHRGVLGGVLRLQSNALFAVASREAGAFDARDLVIDREGTILAHPTPERVLGKAQDEAGLAAVFARWRDQGSPIDLDGRAEFSQGHMVSMAGIPLSDWMHVRLTPQTRAMQPVAAARLAAVQAALGAGVLAALLAGALAWRLVRPIAVLQRCAQRLLAGSEAGRWPGGGGEVGAVARSFQALLAQRQEQQEAQRNLVAQLEAVLDNAEIGIALSRDSRFVMVSSRFCQIVRNERAAIVGQATRMIHADEAAYQRFSERAHPAFMAHGVFEGEVELVRRDGERFWARMRGRAVVPGDRAHGTIWVVDDITDVRRQREQLAWAASHDALTGLVNRAAFEVRLEEHNAHAAARPFCALFIDLDRFKPVNDGAGHAAGDALLRGVAAALRETVRQSDTVARLGGDEFGVLLPDCPLPRAHALAEQLRAAVESYELLWEERRLSVGASVGLVLCNGAHPSAIDVLREADTACYQAKRAGRGQVAVASGPLR